MNQQTTPNDQAAPDAMAAIITELKAFQLDAHNKAAFYRAVKIDFDQKEKRIVETRAQIEDVKARQREELANATEKANQWRKQLRENNGTKTGAVQEIMREESYSRELLAELDTILVELQAKDAELVADIESQFSAVVLAHRQAQTAETLAIVAVALVNCGPELAAAIAAGENAPNPQYNPYSSDPKDQRMGSRLKVFAANMLEKMRQATPASAMPAKTVPEKPDLGVMAGHKYPTPEMRVFCWVLDSRLAPLVAGPDVRRWCGV